MRKYFNVVIIVLTVSCSSNSLKMKEKKYTPPISYEDAEKRANEMINQLSLNEKLELIGGYKGFYIKGFDKFNTPYIYCADATQGVHIRHEWQGDTLVNQLEKSTAFPCPILLASTWTKDLAYKYAKSVGEECKAGGINILLGPGMNIYRISQCGRNFEYFGEDPYLAARMIENYVVGVQSTGTIATLKHFIANNTDYYRRKSNSVIDERTLHEIYLPAFEAGVNAGAMAVMTSYNLLNGEWCGQSNYVINKLLKCDLGYKWLVMTDWWSVWDGTKVAKSGQDLEMPKLIALDSAKILIEEGKIEEKDIDRMATSILRTLIAAGLYDNPGKNTELLNKYTEHEKIALNTAREGIVLLKNDNNVLPIKENENNIIITGKYVEELARGGGAAAVDGYNIVYLLDAVKAEFGDKVTYIPNPTLNEIKNASKVILSIGTYDSEGWDRSFNLPDDEEDMIIKYVNLNPNTIIVVNSGSGIKMTNWKDKAAAILYAWYPGQVGNMALTQIFSGKVNPSGKLPISIEEKFEDSPGYDYLPNGEDLYTDWNGAGEKAHPVYDVKYKEGVFVGYRWYEKMNIKTLFPFGHGLSYTTFKYSDITISKQKIHKDENLLLFFKIENTGGLKGKEIAQVYIRDIKSSVERPLKELKGFSKLELLPGEVKEIEIVITPRDFSFWDTETRGWIVEEGTFEIMVGSSSQDIHLKTEVVVL